MTTVIPEGALTVEHDGEDLFVLIDGVRIARRGHPDTEEARTWIALHPGVKVVDINEHCIEVQYDHAH